MRNDQENATRSYPFNSVQAVCQTFTMDWQSDSHQSLSGYLEKVNEATRSTLLRNLLQIDIERRRGEGHQPQAADYIATLPSQEALIRQEFAESTLWLGSSRSHPNDDTEAFAASVYEPPSARRLGDYHLVRELGQGGMGVVFEAVHAVRHDHTALKMLPKVDGERLHHFKNEFRSLANINHPNLLGLHSLESDGEQWFFTMDLFHGTDFIDFVRPNGKLDEARLRLALGQLVTGIMALHANYIIHRDLKPSNVMVSQDGHLVLLDFGLVLHFNEDDQSAESLQIAGTPAYMSPEQARGESVRPSCDWYALGVMLYEALTGHLPFRRNTLRVMHDKQTQDAPAIPDSDNLPTDLCNLCMALLARHGDDRPDAMEIARVVSTQTAMAKSSTSTAGDRIIGRDQQLQDLNRALETLNETQSPVVVFVSGRSGEGKTTLSNAFLNPLFNDPAYAVMAGRCYDRESVPFKALDSTIDAMCGYLHSLPPEEVAAFLPPDMAFLKRLFPIFQRLDAVSTGPSIRMDDLEEREVRRRATAALRQLFCRISSRKPVILFTDDLQWGDSDSAEILLQVLKPPAAPRILFLGTYRSDEADDSPFLRAWGEFGKARDINIEPRNIAVSPFTVEECTQLVIDLLHQDTERIRQRSAEIHQETGGNPFFLTELIGCFDPHADSFRPQPIQDVIADRLNRLPAESTRLLNVISVSGRALDMEEASSVAGHDVMPVSTLMRMRSERLIRFLGPETARSVDTYHDCIRETLLAEMEESTKQTLHRDLACFIESASGGLSPSQLEQFEEGILDTQAAITSHRVFDLSFHFDAAGDKRNGCAYAFLAAEQARRQFALDVAATQYALALENGEYLKSAAVRRIQFSLGEISTLLANYPDADAALTEAHRLAEDPLDQYEIELLQGRLLIADCHYGASAERYTKTLRSLNVRVPRTKLGLVFGIMKSAAVQALHTLARYPRRTSRTATRRELLIIQLLDGLIMSVWFRSTPTLFWCHLISMNRAEALGRSEAVHDSYSYHSAFLAPIGLQKRGFRYADRALEAVEEGDLSSLLMNHFARGVGLYCVARFEECQQIHTAGLQLIERTGDMFKAMIMRLHIALSDYRLGNLEPALETTLDAFHASVRLGDFNTAHDFINVTAMVTRGAFRFEEMKAALVAIPDNYQATNQGLQAEARWHLYHGRTREGVEFAQQGFDLAKKHLVINHISMPNFPLLLEALRLHAETVRADDRAEADRLIKRGYKLARWGVRITEKFPDYPNTLREMGHYYAMRGKMKKALKVTEKSCRIAERQQARLELALSESACSQYRYKLGISGSAEVERAQEAVATFSRTVDQIRQKYPLLS
ncbi:Serine/threonine-protein kinase StkP [Novipirellula artificiosorum]|uniref:Serine/threonine-protein kinase StkP n=2 Tax=Novipirellula artificiosorum TaxID=2528016 RepID=A0A5C6DDS3_9BACT|nr:Serine/threonine-protein kinase StkP [Novipirellula artificiosorum]